MTLREPLAHFEADEQPDAYLTRALSLATELAGPSPRLRLEVSQAFGLTSGRSHASASLWVERGNGRSESWQKVTGTITGDSYAELLPLFAAALDHDTKAQPS